MRGWMQRFTAEAEKTQRNRGRGRIGGEKEYGRLFFNLFHKFLCVTLGLLRLCGE